MSKRSSLIFSIVALLGSAMFAPPVVAQSPQQERETIKRLQREANDLFRQERRASQALKAGLMRRRKVKYFDAAERMESYKDRFDKHTKEYAELVFVLAMYRFLSGDDKRSLDILIECKSLDMVQNKRAKYNGRPIRIILQPFSPDYMRSARDSEEHRQRIIRKTFNISSN